MNLTANIPDFGDAVQEHFDSMITKGMRDKMKINLHLAMVILEEDTELDMPTKKAVFELFIQYNIGINLLNEAEVAKETGKKIMDQIREEFDKRK